MSSPPDATIDTPATDLVISVGGTLDFTATATDPDSANFAGGSLVEPGTRALIHTDSQNAEGPPKGDPSSFGGGGGNARR